ncbi:beta-ketoacyl synthase chain length factor [Xanthomonas sp. AmX2]|uniref:beta-ketoacyl synthase chain length factor n=1 Tax=Xanthomonas sp. TaxID=29446 RepID=UPI00197D3748|nr:beta-ketoacyl synthase chain length factor [Xanthomonas sp.]MBN6149109.1 beta-ketoacyl synthase chain length factor [Xanthomonas sp.]
MTRLSASVEGIGFWSPGLPSWTAARAFADGSGALLDTPPRPAPQLLAANERRRAPDTVAVSLEAALAACQDAGRDPATLPSVFTSTHGDLAITDYMCATLASDPLAISPTKFHNSVHNAAAGYWTIGAGATAAATAISAHQASFAQGLLEALAQLAAGAEAVLLVGYDSRSVGPLGRVSRSEGLCGGALVLAAAAAPDKPRLSVQLLDGEPEVAGGALSRHAAGNAMAPMLALFDALAAGGDGCTLRAGPGRCLRVELTA